MRKSPTPRSHRVVEQTDITGCSLSGCERRRHEVLRTLSPERGGAVSSTGQKERITNVHTVGSKGQEADRLFLSRYIGY